MPKDANWRCGVFEWELRKKVPYTYEAGGQTIESWRLALERVVDETDTESMADPNVRCSYCGSMTPEAMMKAMRAGEKITPTDKAYKIYVDPDHNKFYMNHLTSVDLSREFWSAYVSKRMVLAHPGHFYSRIWLPALTQSQEPLARSPLEP